MFFPFLSGVLSYLSLPPLSWWLFSFVALVPLFIFLVREERVWRIILGCFFYQAVFLFPYLIFAIDPFFIFSNVFLGILFPLVIVVLKHFSPDRRWVIILPLIFATSEYIQAYWTLLPGFAAMIGTSLSNTPFLGAARFGGFFGSDLFLAVINTLGAATYLSIMERETAVWKGAVLRYGFSAFILMVAVFTLPARSFPTEGNAFTISTVSVEAGYSSDSYKFESHAPLSKEERAGIKNYLTEKLASLEPVLQSQPSDLVVLPENVVLLELSADTNPEAYEVIGVKSAGEVLIYYQGMARRLGSNLIATMPVHFKDGKKYIASIWIGRDGSFKGIYRKYHLTIVSEYWPFGSWAPFYWKWQLASLPPQTRGHNFIAANVTGEYTRTDEPFGIFEIEGVRVAPVICSEGHYPNAYRGVTKKGAEVILHISSNEWVAQGKSAFDRVMVAIRQVYSEQFHIPILTADKAGESISVWGQQVKYGSISGPWSTLTSTIFR